MGTSGASVGIFTKDMWVCGGVQVSVESPSLSKSTSNLWRKGEFILLHTSRGLVELQCQDYQYTTDDVDDDDDDDDHHHHRFDIFFESSLPSRPCCPWIPYFFQRSAQVCLSSSLWEN